ncbi:MAG TPA: hypothetical protein VMV07_23670 [Streptosporangiaceae bacterium]|nr:hypothetical protein [Streptosporangiaceae bacterium]
MSRKPSPEQHETVRALLDAAKRSKPEVPLRRELLQQGEQRQPRPGPLRDLVRRHDERALDLYLLLRAAASAYPWDVKRDARIWGRAIGLASDADGGRAAISKTWARLESTYHLVRRERAGRLARVVVLHEAGNGEQFTYPQKDYFKLPFAYWTDEEAWYVSLTFAAKATLLVALSLRPPFALPAERAPAWYGLSADTVDRGLRELRHAGLLTRSFTEVQNWLSPTGKTTQYKFTLRPPFARPARKPASRGHLRAVGE